MHAALEKLALSTCLAGWLALSLSNPPSLSNPIKGDVYSLPFQVLFPPLLTLSSSDRQCGLVHCPSQRRVNSRNELQQVDDEHFPLRHHQAELPPGRSLPLPVSLTLSLSLFLCLTQLTARAQCTDTRAHLHTLPHALGLSPTSESLCLSLCLHL